MANSGAPRARRTPMQALVYWTLVLGVWGLIFMVAFLAVFATGLPDTSTLNQVQRQPSISYLDRSGAVIGVRGGRYRRRSTSPSCRPTCRPPSSPSRTAGSTSTSASTWGIARAVVTDLADRGAPRRAPRPSPSSWRATSSSPPTGMRAQGAGADLRGRAGAKFSKKQILGLYLSRVYFGAGAYGIEAAAERYFEMSAAQLTIREAAMLAAIMKSPTATIRPPTPSASPSAPPWCWTPWSRPARSPTRSATRRCATPGARLRDAATPRSTSSTGWTASSTRWSAADRGPDRRDHARPADEAAAEQAARGGVAAHADQGVSRPRWCRWTAQGRVRAMIGGASTMPTARSTARSTRTGRPARRGSRSST